MTVPDFLAMNDAEFLMWISVFMVTGWPLLVSLLVYVIQRSRIERTARYFVVSLLTGYGLAILTPVAVVFGAMFLGRVAEVAVVAAILLTTPVVVVLTTVAAVYWSGRYGTAGSGRAGTGVGG